MPRTIAITGASGSGKSTLAEGLVARCQQVGALPSASLLSVDAYYRDLAHLSFEERDALNFDHPDAIEFELFAEHLQALKRAESIQMPIYDFSRHTRAPGGVAVASADWVIAEGVLLGAWPKLRAQVDVLVFVEAPLHVCLQRRIARDGRERGRSAESVKAFWRERVLPAYIEWADTVQTQSDIVLSGEEPLQQSLDRLIDFLRS